MIIVSIDPSGNHPDDKQGAGTTGIAVDYGQGDFLLKEISAKDFTSAEAYWFAVIQSTLASNPDIVVIEGYRLYNHKGQRAEMQANSTFPTSQLIGALRMALYNEGIPLHTQYAVDVKTRWSDDVLKAKGILEAGNKYKGQPTNAHKRDALRHLLHFKKYKMKDVK